MKSADLETGVLYAVGGSMFIDSKAYVLDPVRQYSAYDFHTGQRVQPNFSGKGTHVLILVRARFESPDHASDEEAARYTLVHYQGKAKVPLPKGWHVRKEAPVNIRRTWEDQLRIDAVIQKDIDARVAAQNVTRQQQALATAEMTELLSVYQTKAKSVGPDTVTFTHEQVYRLLGIDLESKEKAA